MQRHRQVNQVYTNPVGSKNSNLLSDPDFTTEMLADQRAARPVSGELLVCQENQRLVSLAE